MKTQWFKIGLLIVTYLVAVTVKTWIAMQDEPISSGLQRVVERRVRHEAALRPLYDEAMSDGKVTFGEARMILNKANEIERTR
jgi:hypothetical protein